MSDDLEFMTEHSVRPPSPLIPDFSPSSVSNAANVFKSMAKHLMSKEIYDQALSKLNLVESLTKDPKDLSEILLLRSRCHLELCDIPKARIDCEKAMTLNDNFYLQFHYANVLYSENLFENALVTYERGSRLRTYPDLFGNGVNVATGTIENCVGINAGPMLSQNKLGKLITEMKMIDLELLEPKKKIISEEERKKQEEMMNELRRTHSGKYLGVIAQEKFTMMDMLACPALYGENRTHNEMMETLLETSVDRLEVLQDCLHRRKPLYCYEYLRGKPAPNQEKEAAEEIKLRKRLLHGEIERQLKKLDEFFYLKDWATLYQRAEYLRNKLWNLPLAQFPWKTEYIAKVIDALGLMYMEMKTLHRNWSHDWNDKRLRVVLGIHQQNDLVFEVAKWSFHMPIINNQKKIDEFLELIKMTDDQYQLMYYNFEAACLFSAMNNAQQTRFHARLATFGARKESNTVWFINSLFVLCRAEIQERNFFEAIVTLMAVRETCIRYGYKDQKIFIDRALSILQKESKTKGGVPKEMRGVQQREAQIIELMPNIDLKCQARTLILKRNKRPPWRRMPLMKGAAQLAAAPAAKASKQEVKMDEATRLEGKKLEKKKAKEARQAAALKAAAIAQKSGRIDYSTFEPIHGMDGMEMKNVIDSYRRRSTFDLDMFHY